MSDVEECFKCKVQFDWNNLLWEIGKAEGMKSKTHKCDCGHEMHMFKAASAEKKEHWRKLFGISK